MSSLNNFICKNCGLVIAETVDEYGYFMYHVTSNHQSCRPEDPETTTAELKYD